MCVCVFVCMCDNQSSNALLSLKNGCIRLHIHSAGDDHISRVFSFLFFFDFTSWKASLLTPFYTYTSTLFSLSFFLSLSLSIDYLSAWFQALKTVSRGQNPQKENLRNAPEGVGDGWTVLVPSARDSGEELVYKVRHSLVLLIFFSSLQERSIFLS